MGCAIVILELVRGQPIIRALGFLVGKQGGNRKSPAALGTRPACQSLVRYPGKPSAHSLSPIAAGTRGCMGPNTFLTSYRFAANVANC